MVKTKVIQEELETRKQVERAKGILMKELKLDEEEAFGRIRKKSMDSRRSMRDVAEAIILAHEIGT
jgi:AmiR/NasT family two-component response regulator